LKVDTSIFGAGDAEGDCDGRDEVEAVGEAEGGFEGDGAAEFDAPVDLDADGGGELVNVADGGSCEAPAEGSGEEPVEGSGDAPDEGPGVGSGVQTRAVPFDENPGKHTHSDHVFEGSH